MTNLYKEFSAKASGFFEWLGRNSLVMVLIIIIAHLLIKSIHLGDASFWYDEAYSVYYSQKTVGEIIDNAKYDHNPPFYNLILKVWMICFGNTEAAVRWLSVVFSSLTGVALFLFCRRHFNIQTAFFASVLFLASNVHLYYAHEARSYALTSLLNILSLHFCLEVLKRPSNIRLVALGAINAAILYTHFLTGFLFIVEFIIALIFLRHSRKGFVYYLLSQILTIIFFIPWISALVNMVKQTNKGFWLGHPSWQDFVNVFYEFAMGKDLLIFYGILIAVTLVLIIIFRRKETGKTELINILILILWGFLPIFIDYYIAAFTPVFLLRYILYASLGLMVLIAYLLSLNPGGWLPKIIFMAVLAVILFGRIDYSPAKNQDFKRAVPIVKNEKDSKTLVVLSSIDLFFIYAYYYDKNYFTDYYNTIPRLIRDNTIMTNDSIGLSKFDFSKYRKIVLIQSFEGYADPQGTLFNYLETHFERKKLTKEFTGITVAVFNNKNYNPTAAGRTEKTIFEDKELTPATIEGTNGWENIRSLTNEMAIEGKYSSKLTPENPQSITFVKDISAYNLGLSCTVKLGCLLYSHSSGEKAEFLIHFLNNKNEIISWNGRQAKTYKIKPDTWNKLEFYCPYPARTDSITKVKAYIQLNGGKDPVFVDDIRLEIEK